MFCTNPHLLDWVRLRSSNPWSTGPFWSDSMSTRSVSYTWYNIDLEWDGRNLCVHSWKFLWNRNMEVWQMSFLFKLIFHGLFSTLQATDHPIKTSHFVWSTGPPGYLTMPGFCIFLCLVMFCLEPILNLVDDYSSILRVEWQKTNFQLRVNFVKGLSIK